jgi:acetyl-CoA C-acetyltransferase
VSNKDESRIVHPMELVEAATRAALDQAGIDSSSVGGVYTTPLSSLTEDDAAGMLADALDAGPGPRVVSTYSGAAPQRLLAAACRAVAAGEIDVAVVAGGIADASVRRARRAGIEPPAGPTSVWSQGSKTPLPKDFRRDWGPAYIPEIGSGAGLPASYFALVQSVLDSDRPVDLGQLMAPFTATAARRPDLAWFPTARSAADIAVPSPDNRMVAEPYTKRMCSFPTVDLAAALVVTADGRKGGVYPRVISAAKEAVPPAGWPDMSRPASLQAAVSVALERSGWSPDEMGAFDFYSCFPAAVLLAARELGLAHDDPRGLTASGGLPYFGGPGASYSIHGLACLFEDMAAGAGPLGLAVGVGGMVTYFSVGIYSLEPVPFDWIDIPEPEAPPVPTDPAATGRCVVDAMTVLHTSGAGPVEAPVIGRTRDGARFGARLAESGLAKELAGRSLVGGQIDVERVGDRLVYRPV